MPGSATRANALDHLVVVVLFENRVSGQRAGPPLRARGWQDLLGCHRPGAEQPDPGSAEHGADRKVVPYGVSAGLDSPNPDSGEEWYHANTQLFGTINDHNRGKIGEGVTKPWNAPPPGAVPTMDGFVTDYISTFTGEVGRQPTYEEHAQIMTGYTPGPAAGAERHRPGVRGVRPLVQRSALADVHEPVVLDGGHIVRPGRQPPDAKMVHQNDTETIFERLEQHGRTGRST
jgi:phospholipase C